MKLEENKWHFALMRFVVYCKFVESEIHTRCKLLYEFSTLRHSFTMLLPQIQCCAKCCSCFLQPITWMPCFRSLFAAKLIFQISIISLLSYYNTFSSLPALFCPHFSKFYDLVTFFLIVTCTVWIHSLISPLTFQVIQPYLVGFGDQGYIML